MGERSAIALRVLVVAGLFVMTDHSQVPFGTFFGDEEYFLNRSLWLRNVALGVPVHALDLEYAFEPFGRSGYLYLLALIQLLVGPSPYGLHLLGVFFYVLAIRCCTAWSGPRSVACRRSSVSPSCCFFQPLRVVGVGVERAAVRPRQRSEPDPRCQAGTRILAAEPWPGGCRYHRARRGSGGHPQDGRRSACSGVLVGLTIGFLADDPVDSDGAGRDASLLGAVLSLPDVQLAYVAIQSAARPHWRSVASPVRVNSCSTSASIRT